MNKPLAIFALTTAAALVALGDTAPIPQSLLGSDYITFNGSSFPGNGSSLICFPAGCGGAFNATINSGTTQQPGGVSATVWCVDYQLDVTTSSQYAATVKSIASIATPTDDNVRYGNLNSVSAAGGWANGLSDPTGLDTNQTNSAAYRYALAAALVSQYTPSPQDVSGSDARNVAIQEAVWYVTYNSDYTPGATWPPLNQGIPTSGSCGAGSVAGTAAPTGGAASDFSCWVQYAEDNANKVNTSQWAVISGPADSFGSLQDPAVVNGYPSYQTFLVEVGSSSITTGSGGSLPEPSYYALLGLSCLAMFVVARRRRKA